LHLGVANRRTCILDNLGTLSFATKACLGGPPPLILSSLSLSFLLTSFLNLSSHLYNTSVNNQLYWKVPLQPAPSLSLSTSTFPQKQPPLQDFASKQRKIIILLTENTPLDWYFPLPISTSVLSVISRIRPTPMVVTNLQQLWK
jgi:hypothetical protein